MTIYCPHFPNPGWEIDWIYSKEAYFCHKCRRFLNNDGSLILDSTQPPDPTLKNQA